MEEQSLLRPGLVASTEKTHNTPDEGAVLSNGTVTESAADDRGSSFFKSAQWSPDGTCILTNSEDNRLRTFVLYIHYSHRPKDITDHQLKSRPVDLLSNESPPSSLNPYSTVPSATPTYALTPYPFFSLSNPSTALFLSSPQDLPIRLSNALYATNVHTYPLIHPPTERYITPHSLHFTSSGTQFIAGSDSLLSVFDVSRNGKGPVQRLPTVPSKRRKIVGGGVGMKGIISALSISCDGILAAGTFTRWIGLYGDEGRGDCVAVFPLDNASLSDDCNGIVGTGVTQTLWSACGRYLYVVERMSDGLLVYDIRVAGKKLGWLRGRKAKTNQRMSVDSTVNTNGEQDIWAGGTDGVVRVWRNPSQSEGGQDLVGSWKAHNDVVSSTVVHPSGTVVATCSGSRHPPVVWDNESSDSDTSDGSSQTDNSKGERIDGERPIDNSLKIWAV